MRCPTVQLLVYLKLGNVLQKSQLNKCLRTWHALMLGLRVLALILGALALA